MTEKIGRKVGVCCLCMAVGGYPALVAAGARDSEESCAHAQAGCPYDVHTEDESRTSRQQPVQGRSATVTATVTTSVSGTAGVYVNFDSMFTGG
jgi:hypothetical protein